MSLANRLSGFFLAALAVALGGFSVTLFLLSRAHFQRDFDERLMDVMDVLAASADVDPGRVEWKPGARPAIKSPHSQDAPVRWAVSNGRGEVVDHCWKDIRERDLARILGMGPTVGHAHSSFTDGDGRRWRLVVRRIQAGPPSPTGGDNSTRIRPAFANRGRGRSHGAVGGQFAQRGINPGRSLHCDLAPGRGGRPASL